MFKRHDRIEIPVHYDLWMRGARIGTIVGGHKGKTPAGDYCLVQMDHPQVRRPIKLWRADWDYAKAL